jgi:hypothetical protein
VVFISSVSVRCGHYSRAKKRTATDSDATKSVVGVKVAARGRTSGVSKGRSWFIALVNGKSDVDEN